MTIAFPETMAFSGYDAPMRLEGSIRDLEIIGELPSALQGSWYRCGPDPQYPPYLGDDVFISGDGMVSHFRFDRGHVDFQQRYVETERLKADRAARRSLFGAYRNPHTDDASVRGISRGTANTAIILHAGRLLALKEDSLPIELDPNTLETRGIFDFGGQLRCRTMTAHPKIDPLTGELLAYAYEAEGDGSSMMALIVADADGKLVREEWFEPPYVGMIHDFAVTADYIIFPLFPTLFDAARFQRGGLHWMTDQRMDAMVGVMPRGGSVWDLRWFRRPGGHAYHVINAFNEGSSVHVDMAVSEINSFPFIPDISGEPYDPRKAAPFPSRWTIDTISNEDGITERPLGTVPGDLPRIDDRRTGQPYRHFYMPMLDPSRVIPKGGPVGGAFNMLGSIETLTGQVRAWYGDDATSFQEPQFVAAGPGEQDGYVLCVLNRHDQNRADVGVFNAAAIDDGPLATIRLPIRLRFAFHGCWAAD